MTEALARLTAGTQDWDCLPWGASELSPMDIAAALAGSREKDTDRKDAKRDLVLAAFSGYQPTRLLVTQVVAEGSKYFRVTDPDYTRGLLTAAAELAIGEAIYPRLCWRCGGRKELRGPHGVVRTCEHCGGTGLGHVREREAAQWMGVTRHRWRETYRWKYLQLLAALEQWTGEEIGRARRRLKAA